MKIVKILMSFLMWNVIVGMIATKLAEFGVPVWCTATVGVAMTFGAAFYAPATRGYFEGLTLNDVDVNIWAREIIKRLFKDNMFLKYAKNENQYVIGGAAVLIPQPGARPTVVKNRSSFPATTIRRSDTTVLYELDEYSTNPTHITLNELQTISYDKIQSIISDHFGYLVQDVADDMLIKWAAALPSAAILNTTGEDTAGLESGQTGLRKALVWQDLAKAQAVMNKANVAKDGRVALIEENMFQQFMSSLSNSPYKDFSRAMNEKDGDVPRLFGFDIMTRSNVITAARDLDTDTLDVNALDAAIGATDDVVSLCWQRDIVAAAQGALNLFSKTNDPQFYGDVHSVSMRSGGRVRRADSLGIVAIKQGASGGN